MPAAPPALPPAAAACIDDTASCAFIGAKPTGAICNLGCSYCYFLDKEELYAGDRFRMSLDTAERYVIMQGEGRVEVGDLPPQTVGPGDVVLIPAGCRQRIANVGTIDLCFLAICTPRFQAANYCDLEAS